MSGGVTVGRLFGIDIRIHFSWLLVFLLVAWSLATGFLPQSYPGWTQNAYWEVGIAGSILLFVSVLLHELSHSLVAISRNYRVRSITLFLLGGVSNIEKEATSPGSGFWIAVVGPVTSFLLAGVLWTLFLVATSFSPQIRALVGYLALVNGVLGVFNMIPAFPLDGGRVLEALVWKTTNSAERARGVVTTTGLLFGYGLIGLGLYFAFTGTLVTGLWLMFIGWFIQSAASSGRAQQIMHMALSGWLVRDVMSKQLPTVVPGTTVQELVDDRMMKEFYWVYVVSLGDTFKGIVTASDVRGVPPKERPQKWITEIMTPAAKVVSVTPDEQLEVALRQMASNNLHQLMVIQEGKPVGLITRGDVLRAIEITQLFPRSPHRWPQYPKARMLNLRN